VEPFKNAIDAAAVDRIARFVGGDWDREGFRTRALEGLDALELKARVVQVADALRAQLHPDWPVALDQILADLPPEPTDTDDLTGSMGLWPVLTAVERHGLAHPERSLEALGRLTPFWSAEFAVRPYFAADPARMVRWVERWSTDANVHRRRLASEGSRPRLPWGIRLQCRIDEPTAVLPALTRLRDDPSAYVRRSVANHLNDIAKDHPDVVLAVARDWLPGTPTTGKLVRHALRTQIKAGSPAAYRLLGLEPFVGGIAFHAGPAEITVGEALDLELTLHPDREQRVRIDFGLHHRLASGDLSPKIFHWTERTVRAGRPLTLTKRYVLREVTTRRLHAGRHAIDVRINGVASDPIPFDLSL
jgi:3-methyladenine DNA glycosylase AlkC